MRGGCKELRSQRPGPPWETVQRMAMREVMRLGRERMRGLGARVGVGKLAMIDVVERPTCKSLLHAILPARARHVTTTQTIPSTLSSAAPSVRMMRRAGEVRMC